MILEIHRWSETDNEHEIEWCYGIAETARVK